MTHPFDGIDPQRRAALQPLSENPFRVLDLPIDSTDEAIHVALDRVRRAGGGAMLCLGPAVRPNELSELLDTAKSELGIPARASVHALFHPWLRQLPVDEQAIPEALRAVSDLLAASCPPSMLSAQVARELLPRRSQAPAAEVPEAHHGRLFPGDVDLVEILGPLKISAGSPQGFLAALGRTPAALSDAVLAATRVGKARRLHASYLRALLAQADAGEPSALRRLPSVGAFFEEVATEPAGGWILGWRALLEGRPSEARKLLNGARAHRHLEKEDRAQIDFLLARLDLLEGDRAGALARLKACPKAPQATMVKGLLSLVAGDPGKARKPLEEAWEALGGPRRLAPAVALAALGTGDVDRAEEILGSALHQGNNADYARSWLAMERGEGAVEQFKRVISLQPQHRGAWYAVAGLSKEKAERARARATLRASAPDEELRADLVRWGLADNSLDEVEATIEGIQDSELRAQALDRLGRRAEAWTARSLGDAALRDEARRALDSGQPLAALRQLAGISLADPLRRRAARAALIDALGADPEADPDRLAERVIGRVSPEEKALVDLPIHKYRAVKELEAGQIEQAIISLRRHLDGETDAVATHLFNALTSAEADNPDQGQPGPVDDLLWALANRSGSADLEALVAAGEDLAPPIWEAAVVRAAQKGLAIDAGIFEGGTEELQVAAGLMRCRRGLSRGDWSAVAGALESIGVASARLRRACERARSAVEARRFPEAIRTDPRDAARALEGLLRSEANPKALHDAALWRTVVLLLPGTAAEPSAALEARTVVPLFKLWSEAMRDGALAHPARPASARILEDELENLLARILNLVAPGVAEEVTSALQNLGGPLVKRTMERAGWAQGGRTKAHR